MGIVEDHDPPLFRAGRSQQRFHGAKVRAVTTSIDELDSKITPVESLRNPRREHAPRDGQRLGPGFLRAPQSGELALQDFGERNVLAAEKSIGIALQEIDDSRSL